MLKTNLEWHYFKDGVPEVGRRYLHLYKNGDVIFTILYAKIEDEEAYCERHRLDMWAYLTTPIVKEFHVWLDDIGTPNDMIISYETTKGAYNIKQSIINTTQTAFLKTYILDDYRLFVHRYGEVIELTLGSCQGTDREIKTTDNLEKLVLGGEFDFH